jgi:pyrroloquinoline quinone biosynthesis protein B
MRVVLLGAAAGGGLPQWNCACQNCTEARAGEIRSSTQSSLAFSAEGVHWFLVNASPDLPRQIECSDFLRPQAGSGRHSPIEGVLLTNADLDHILGLVLMREGGRLQVHAPAGVREALVGGLNFDALADAFSGADWHLPPEGHFQPLVLREDGTSGLNYRVHPLSSDPPRYARSAGGTQSVAYEIHDPRTGGRLMVAPDVASISSAFLEAMQEADAIVFDGTFWSSTELREFRRNARTSEQMGHLPISTGSLDILRTLPARHKIYVHINNTNPVWRPNSLERKDVEQAGVQIGYDGLAFEL